LAWWRKDCWIINKKLSKHSAVLYYNFHDQILEPEITRVPESFKTIGKRAGSDTARLVADYKYKSVHLVGISLGSAGLAMAAKNYPGFSSCTLVVAGDNLATLMWDGSRTQGIRRSFSEQGITKQELDNAWQEIAPKNQAITFKGKNVKF
jgi:hypothetical protein